MSEHDIIGFIVGALITAIISQGLAARRRNEDEQRKDTGRRIGGLEKRADWWEGFFEGVKYGKQLKGDKDGK